MHMEFTFKNFEPSEHLKKYARRRLEILKEFLPIVGIDPARFEYTWVSASEGGSETERRRAELLRVRAV